MTSRVERTSAVGRGSLRLAVTGANGYVGGRFVAAACASEHFEVISVVRSPARWVQGEVRRVASLEEEAKAALQGAHAVVHLAGANEMVVHDEPDRAVASTVSASRAVAEACSELGVVRLVYVSTVHVYGAALRPGAVVDESTSPSPQHPYAEARLQSERVMTSTAGGSEVVVLRLTNGVGPPANPSVDRWSLVVNDLCRQVVCRGHVRLRSDGTQWRDFIALDDVDRVLLAAADPSGMPPGTYNLGSGDPKTVLEVATEVARLAAARGFGDGKVEAPPATADPPAAYRVSVEKLAQAGFRPRTPLTDAVAGTLSFCAFHRDSICG